MKRGRPLGEISRAVIQCVSSQPMSSRQIARTLQISQGHADKVAYSLTATGNLEIVGREQREGRRPVFIYSVPNWLKCW